MVFEGRKKAGEIEIDLKKRVADLGRKPVLAILWVGDNQASAKYIENKKGLGERIGVEVRVERVEAGELEDRLEKLVDDKNIDGVMVQLPVPRMEKDKVDEILKIIPVDKDVDGLSSENLRLIATGEQEFLPATVMAVGKIMDEAIREVGLDIERMKVAVVGSKGMVGKPLVSQLKRFGFEVGEFDLGDGLELGRYDVVISATGQTGLIKKSMVKKGVVAIDVGFPKGDFEAGIDEVASFVTPVPGGVGPMTVVCLFENLVRSVENE